AISYMLGINYFYGAVVMGIITSIGVGFLSQNTKLKGDTSIGIVFSSFFALGVMLLMKAQTAVDLTQILFGNVLTVRDQDMWLTFGIGILYCFVYMFFIRSF